MWHIRHAEASPEYGHTFRRWVGAALAAVPHILVLVIMGIGVLRADGNDRGFAALIGVAEIYVVPVGLAAALFLRLSDRRRVWSAGLVVGTLAGAAVVLIATLIVGADATWS